MAKTKISEYSSTASNNTDINSINLAEGMAPEFGQQCHSSIDGSVEELSRWFCWRQCNCWW